MHIKTQRRIFLNTANYFPAVSNCRYPENVINGKFNNVRRHNLCKYTNSKNLAKTC